MTGFWVRFDLRWNRFLDLLSLGGGQNPLRVWCAGCDGVHCFRMQGLGDPVGLWFILLFAARVGAVAGG